MPFDRDSRSINSIDATEERFRNLLARHLKLPDVTAITPESFPSGFRTSVSNAGCGFKARGCTYFVCPLDDYRQAQRMGIEHILGANFREITTSFRDTFENVAIIKYVEFSNSPVELETVHN
jgi:hypothetical protein